jgi:hypothetical protein
MFHSVVSSIGLFLYESCRERGERIRESMDSFPAYA